MGDAGMPALPKLLKMITKRPSKSDPRGMEQRYISAAVFGKMLKKSIAGVDRDLLRNAVAAGLQNQDGRSRGAVGGIYDKLTYEEIKPLLPVIREAIEIPAPSGIMFADGIRIQGLRVLAKHHVKEGIPLCLSFLDTDRWNKKRRILSCLQALSQYGTAAKSELPKLRQLEKDLKKHREAKGFGDIFAQIDEMVKELKSDKPAPKLRSIK